LAIISPTSSSSKVPPLAISNQAGPLPLRPGEGPLLVAEQLALDQAFWERADVGRDERPVASRAEVVDGPRDELLPGAALPLDQDRDVGVGDLPDPREDLADGRGLADHLGDLARDGQALAESAVLLAEAVVLERVADLQPEGAEVDRFGDM